MLSPGRDHLKAPREALANVKYRLDFLERAEGDKKFQAGVLEICASDILFYINTFVWQFNPKKPSRERVGPFITWDFQDEALLARPETHQGRKGILWCVEHDQSAVVEKSREMGASWLFLIVQDWLAQFHERTQVLNISRSADAVDDKSPNSLFWKLRFMHEHLPEWFKGEIAEEKMYMGFERTKATITGEASTGRAGVGGRASIIFIDEFSQIKEATEVRQRTASTADCRFFNGTHLGPNTEFFNLCQTPEMVKIQMHWTQHPDKKRGLYRYNLDTKQVECLDKGYEFPADFKFVMDGSPTGGPRPGVRSPWYDWKSVDIGSSRGVAMELDIDPVGSVSQFFNALLIRDLVLNYCREPVWEGDLEYDLDTGEPKGLVERVGGPLKLWVQPDALGQVPSASFTAGADCATGSGATPSCLSMGDAGTGDKAAEYRNPFIDPKEFAVYATALCRLFKDESGRGAFFAWEMCGPGVNFGLRVVELGYRNIFYRTNEMQPFARSPNESPGWYPSDPMKLILLREYESALKSRQFINRSESALTETLSFKYNARGFPEHSGESAKGDPSGARINHGDMVIADALCWKMMKILGAGQSEAQKEDGLILPNSIAGRRQKNEARMRSDEAWS